jgi:hypothetical protein
MTTLPVVHRSCVGCDYLTQIGPVPGDGICRLPGTSPIHVTGPNAEARWCWYPRPAEQKDGGK